MRCNWFVWLEWPPVREFQVHDFFQVASSLLLLKRVEVLFYNKVNLEPFHTECFMPKTQQKNILQSFSALWAVALFSYSKSEFVVRKDGTESRIYEGFLYG